MFRITRGMQVQHVHFPFPTLGHRDLDQDADEEKRADADPPEPSTPPAVENVVDGAEDQS
jgi:hypothetical protein